jgi:hypothetical protein
MAIIYNEVPGMLPAPRFNRSVMEVAMNVPAYLPFYVLGGSVAIIAALLIGLNSALKRADWVEADRGSALRMAAFGLIGWFAFAVVSAWLGAYQGASDRFPVIQYGIAVPILIGALLIWRSSFLARLLEAVPQQWIVAVQLYRALGLIFLVLYASGRLPGLFAWPAGVGDIAVGLFAPFVASRYARNPLEGAGAVRAWNLFGIADLVVAVGTGFLTSPSALQLFALDNPNELVSAFPLVLVPVYLVPLSIVLHLASLAKLQRETASAMHVKA